MHALEDLGYFCIDNIPPEMLERFFEICLRSDKDGRFAAVADIRSRAMFGDLLAVRKKLAAFKTNTRLLYLAASDEVLLRRFKETRRRHPLMIDTACSLQDAITLERQILGDGRESADYVVDTSHLTGGQLKERIAQLFGASMSGMMAVEIVSFGFKFGIPADADLLFDVRCLPNPFYIPQLRPLTGLDAAVRDYIFGFAQSRELLAKINDLICFSLPLYVQEGKSNLVIGVGCTGGRHRSVSFADEISRCVSQTGTPVTVTHRDCDK
jgi:UPF0042 nucleotide-binding protein